MKAIASGNPAVLTLAEADAELQRLAILKKNHADEQYLARRSLRELPETIARLNKRAGDLTADLATLAAHARDPLTIGDRAYAATMHWPPSATGSTPCRKRSAKPRRVPLGRYRGLTFRRGAACRRCRRGVTWKGPPPATAMLSREHRGPRAVLNALDRLADSYAGQMRHHPPGPGDRRRPAPRPPGPPRPALPHDAYLAELTALRDQLKAGLSQATPEPGSRAARRRAGRADQGAESRPHHRRRPRADGTPPHRRRGAGDRPHPPPQLKPAPAIEPPAEPTPAAPAEMPPAEAATADQSRGADASGAMIHPFPESLPPPARPQPAYRQQVARGRRQDRRQLSLF